MVQVLPPVVISLQATKKHYWSMVISRDEVAPVMKLEEGMLNTPLWQTRLETQFICTSPDIWISAEQEIAGAVD